MKRFHEINAEPRNIGEILDDAWRLSRADSMPLLAILGIGMVPMILGLILLFFQGDQLSLDIPLILGILFFALVTGFCQGLCQEIYHRWGEKQAVDFNSCFRATTKRWLSHVIVQVYMLIVLAVLLCYFPYTLILLPLAVFYWMMSLCWHAVLTGGQTDFGKAWQYTRRAGLRHPIKALVLVICRLTLFAIAVINIHLLISLLIWSLDNFAGLSLAIYQRHLTLSNTRYVLLLGLLVWWLLSPYFEAVQYLYYLDIRTRYEGLDLWYRIEQDFSLPASKLSLLLLSTVLACNMASPLAQAQSPSTRALTQARADLLAVRTLMQQAKPYPGGAVWKARVVEIGDQLHTESPLTKDNLQWYFDSASDLGKRDFAADLRIIDSLISRLQQIQQAMNEMPQRRSARKISNSNRSAKSVRELVPSLGEDIVVPEEADPEEEKVEEVEQPQNANGGEGMAWKGDNGMVAPQISGGLITLFLYGIIALLILLIVFAIVLGIVYYLKNRSPKQRIKASGSVDLEDMPENPETLNVGDLWQEADSLAASGQPLLALRRLYTGVLVLLHQAHVIRYERTKTNGEYLDQLRRKAELHPIFRNLTKLFEWKWYGEKACGKIDYDESRGLATQIQSELANRTQGVG